MKKIILSAALFLLLSPLGYADNVSEAVPPGAPPIFRPLTQAEVQQRQIDAAQVPDVPLSEQLNNIFSALDPNLQADLAPLKAAVKLELEQGRTDIAKLIIQRAAIPPELEPLRQQMLEQFPE